MHHTLIEHWDGSAWRVVPSPNVGTNDNVLQGVAATSGTNAWAVGDYLNSDLTSYETLIEHWDGAAWTVVLSPNVGPEDYLQGVVATSETDAWAVGCALNFATY